MLQIVLVFEVKTSGWWSWWLNSCYCCAGRTETIRSCTDLAVEFVRAMEDEAYTREARLKALQAACERHSELIRDAMNGMPGASRNGGQGGGVGS